MKTFKLILGILILFNIMPFCIGALAVSVGFTFLQGYWEGCQIMFGLTVIASTAVFAVDMIKKNL